MIRLIDRYLFMNMLRAQLALTLVLAAVIWIVQTLGLVEDLLGKVNNIVELLGLSLLLLPRIISQVIGPALLVVMLSQLVRMLQNYEYFAIAAGGFGPRHILQPIMALAALVVLIQGSLSFFLSPLASKQMNRARHILVNEVSKIDAKAGTFKEISPGIIMFAEGQAPDGAWQDIVIYVSTGTEQPATYLARSGYIDQSRSGAYILLRDGYVIDDDEASNQIAFGEYALALTNDNKVEANLLPRRTDLMIHQLLNPEAQGITYKPTIVRMQVMAFELIGGLAAPVIFALISLTTIAGSGLSRSGYGRRIILAIALSLAYQIGVIYVANAAGKNGLVWPLLAWPMVAFGLVMFGLLVQNRPGLKRRLLLKGSG